MQQWVVAGGLITDGDQVLLVQNRRRDGSLDWSTPGGVIDPGETVLGGLTREVAEETGLRVTGWAGPLWEVEAHAPDLGWDLRVEVHLATGFEGSITLDDPDDIVVDAAWHDLAGCDACLATSWLPAREPMLAWLAERWEDRRRFRYRLDGPDRASARVHRLA